MSVIVAYIPVPPTAFTAEDLWHHLHNDTVHYHGALKMNDDDNPKTKSDVSFSWVLNAEGVPRIHCSRQLLRYPALEVQYIIDWRAIITEHQQKYTCWWCTAYSCCLDEIGKHKEWLISLKEGKCFIYNNKAVSESLSLLWVQLL